MHFRTSGYKVIKDEISPQRVLISSFKMRYMLEILTFIINNDDDDTARVYETK